MKCSRVALLLLLVLTSGTAGVLAAESGTVPLHGLETLRKTTAFQSPIRVDADELFSNASSPYDMYYANGRYWAGCDKNSVSEDADATGGAGELAIGANLGRCVRRGMSWLAANGKAAIGYASRYWEQAATFFRDHSLNGEEAGLNSDDMFDDFAETGDEVSPVAARHAAAIEPARPKPVECVYVTSCPRHNNATVLATLGKVTVEYPLGSAWQSALSGEFYWVNEESCPTLASNMDFTVPWQSTAGDANQGGKDQKQASAAPSMATRLGHWVKSWLGEWNVAFRNISRQIARLDWTLLLKSQLPDRAVRNTAPASRPIQR